MQTTQYQWMAKTGWQPALPKPGTLVVDVAFCFGDSSVFEQETPLRSARAAFAPAPLFGCSTAGEIAGTRVSDRSLVVTVVHFAHTRVQPVAVSLAACGGDCAAAGERLAQALPPEDLAHVLVLSDGHQVNGSELVRGLLGCLPAGVTVTGGLAGDGTRFQRTWVISDGAAIEGAVTTLGLYGQRLRVGYGSLGGWDAFGPERRITRSRNNVLYQLDDQPALALYKRYLGDYAHGLPATGLLFPLSVRLPAGGSEVVRTILAVDEAEQSLTFAGDLPEGAYARLMKANFDRVVDGAHAAAHASYIAIGERSPELALLISCVGRRLVLKQRVEEELEAARDVLGAEATLTGFYSYGEICPSAPRADCQLHNQTMTITTLSES